MYSSETYIWYVVDYGTYSHLTVMGAFSNVYGVSSTSIYSYGKTQFLAVF